MSDCFVRVWNCGLIQSNLESESELLAAHNQMWPPFLTYYQSEQW